LMVGQMYPN
jgi:thioredoxin 1